MSEKIIGQTIKSKNIGAWIIGAMCVIGVCGACGGREAKGQLAIKGLSVGVDIAEAKTVCMDLLKDCVALDNGAVPIISKDQDIGGIDIWEVGVSGGKQVLISAASGKSQDPIVAAYGGKKIMEGAIGFDAFGKSYRFWLLRGTGQIFIWQH